MAKAIFLSCIFFLVTSVMLPTTTEAGVLTSSEAYGTSGTTFTVNWAQGCPVQTISIPGNTIQLQAAGPNACATTSSGDLFQPYHCPVSSVGTTSFTQNCNSCGCGVGLRCTSATGACAACADPCASCGQAVCTYEWDTRDGAADCSVVNYQCFTPTINAFAEGYCDWGAFNRNGYQTRSRTIPLDNVWRTLYPTYPSSSDNFRCFNLFGTCTGAQLQARASSSGVECRVSGKWGTCAGIGISDCYFDDYSVRTRCYWDSGASALYSFSGPINPGQTVTRSVECRSFLGVSHGADVRITRHATLNSVDCEIINPYGTAGGVALVECLP